MPLTLNIRHLNDQTLRLEGELPTAELELEHDIHDRVNYALGIVFRPR